MLVKPSIDDLLLKIDNKFKLVTLAMKRARHINDGDPDIKSYNSAKPISRALQEIYNGDVFVKYTTEETPNNETSSASELVFSLGNSENAGADEELSLKNLDDDSITELLSNGLDGIGENDSII